MDLPESLQLARTLNASPIDALAQLQLQTDDICGLLKPLLPYLTLPALLLIASRPSCSALFPPNADDAVKSRLISELIDFQRDWLVEDCPVELRDEYLVDAFAVNGQPAWSELTQDGRFKMVVPRGTDLVVKASATATKGQVCASLHDFEIKLKEMSGGLLEKLDWSNVCLGGGAVLGILTGKMDDDSCKDSDLDLFIHGLEPGQLVAKVTSIIQQLRAALSDIDLIKIKFPGVGDIAGWSGSDDSKLLLIKGFNAVSVVPPLGIRPRRVVQIILASHPSIAETMTDFDLDCCCMGYDGRRVLALPRAARSLALGDWTSGVNLLDTRLSRKLERYTTTRTIKYKFRGYDLALPPAAVEVLQEEGVDLHHMLDRGRVKIRNNPRVSLWNLAGLAGVLKYEHDRAQLGHGHGPHADYGRAPVPYWKVISQADLEKKENSSIKLDFVNFNFELSNMVQRLIGIDKHGSAEVDLVDPESLDDETGAVPYVQSYDEELLLGLSRPDSDPTMDGAALVPEAQWQTLIAKLPDNVAPLANSASTRLTKIKSGITASDDFIAMEIDESPGQEFESKILVTKADSTSIAEPLLAVRATHLSTKQTPLSPTEVSFAHSSGYSIFAVEGLLQFAHVDPEIDRFKNLVWQAWCMTARAAVTLDLQLSLLRWTLPIPKTARLGSHGKEKLSPTVVKVLDRLEDERNHMRETVSKSGAEGSKRREVGVWDTDRRRWLLQWMNSEDMV